MHAPRGKQSNQALGNEEQNYFAMIMRPTSKAADDEVWAPAFPEDWKRVRDEPEEGLYHPGRMRNLQ